MRDTAATIEWLKRNDTTAELGYNPNGRCLQITREARGLPARYPSAVSAQEATPEKHRIRKVEDIVQGMVIYYDDPRDDNPFGHVGTVMGRFKGADRKSLHSLAVKTNSVVSGRTVTVRGDFFGPNWGDPFVFASDWLNGFVLDLPGVKKDPDYKPSAPLKRAEALHDAIEDLQRAIRHHRKKGNDRLVAALQRDVAEIRQTIEKFSKKKR